MSVIAAERNFQLLAENRFEANFIASPAVAEDYEMAGLPKAITEDTFLHKESHNEKR